MSGWQERGDGLDSSLLFDPLCVERSEQVSDEEAAQIEAICQAATPGPMVLDDQAGGEGSMVASLPDGRTIVSLTTHAAYSEAERAAAIEANARLICKARYFLLRLLRDRERWQEERAALLDRLGALEAELERLRTLEVELVERRGTQPAGKRRRGPFRPR